MLIYAVNALSSETILNAKFGIIPKFDKIDHFCVSALAQIKALIKLILIHFLNIYREILIANMLE